MSILVVGECLSQTDEGVPFSDGNGKMFKAFLRQSGIDPRYTTFLNVFPDTPPRGGNVLGFFCAKEDSPKHIRMLKANHYINSAYWPHVERIRALVLHHKPNLVLAVGAAAMWALTSETSIKNARGRITSGNSALPDQKILPIYSARDIQADWPQRVITLADLAKARREMDFPEIRRPQHFVHLHPTLEDMEDFLNEYILPSEELSVDIETKKEIITCVGIAPSTDRVLVIPFFTEDTSKSNNYWETPALEILAWRFIQRVFALKKRLKGQNFQYDTQYFWRLMGIELPSFSDDTMLLHHSLQPEMLKGLGFLASVYTDEVAWKFMHKQSASDRSVKKEDTA